MNKLLTTIAAIAAITAAAQAKHIDIGGYFSIDIPRSWQVTESGNHVHALENYTVYQAVGANSGITIEVLNTPTWQISFEEFSSLTDADLPRIAQANHRIGWTLPVVRKIELDGIPVLLFRQKQDGISLLTLDLWIADKYFRVVFVYTKDAIPTINKMMESMKCGMPFMPPTAQNGLIGDF